jgi:hypothetical protein
LSSKDSIGFNYVLKKAIVSNIMEEYVIDTSGELVKYLYNPRKKAPANYQDGVPIIESKFIAPGMVAAKNLRGKWDIRKF